MPDREMFRDLCENANDLIQSVDVEGNILYVNRMWLETLGYTHDDTAKLNIFEIIHPDSRAHCAGVFQELLEGKEQARIEADFQTKDGRRIPLEGNVTCKSENGRPVSTRGIFRDLRERRRAKEEIDRLFNLAQDMMCVAGTDGYLKQVNPAFERVLGYSQSELLKVAFIDFVHPADRQATIDAVQKLAHGESVVDFENRYMARDGSWRWLAWRSTPVPEEGLIYATARDVTERKRVQALLARQTEELARSNADLETFAYAASHDLRSPLRSIAKLTGWIEQDLGKDVSAKVLEHLEKLKDRAGRMDTLIDELLAYSRAGQRERLAEEVDIAELVRAMTELLGPPAGLSVVGEDLPTLQTPKAPIEQILRNLIDNAIKHHDRADGRIVVSARKDGDWYEFSVSDDGPGIPEEDRERVFGTFETGAATERPGHGLGLSLVQRLVETYGGRIWIENVKPRGAAFHFTWPAHLESMEKPDGDDSGR